VAPALRPATSLDCGRNAIAAAMRDLFPPAPDRLRAISAESLARCRAVGSEGVLAAALNLSTASDTVLAITRALTTFPSPVTTDALRAIVRSRRPSAVRMLAMSPLAAAGDTDDLVAVLGDVREDESVRIAALGALTSGGRPPDRTYLAWLKLHSGPALAQLADDMAAGQRHPEIAGATSDLPAPRLASPPVAGGAAVDTSGAPPRPSGAAEPSVKTPDASAVPTGPVDGTPVAIGASTVAGAALMLNLSLLGVQDTTPQLLLGTAGAVIGFGTSWALSRFGVRPTLEQAAWFANVTAWGTLAGITIYGGSGASNYKLQYGSLVIGEMAGMATGVWSARRWRFTGPEIVMSDSLFLGAAAVGFGIDRIMHETPRVTAPIAIAVVPVMIAAAVAGHTLDPTRNDLILMTGAAIGGGWLGGLFASGVSRTSMLASRQGQGGILLGMGLGYLGGAATGAFTEVSPRRLELGGMGMAAGNLLGLGVNMMATGLTRSDGGTFAAGDRDSWKLGSALGGLALGAAGFALAPRLTLGPRAVAMTMWGTGYGAGTYWLAAVASYHGQPINETTDAVLQGGMLAAGVAGGMTGLLLSGTYAPGPADQWTAFGTTAATVAAGWGTAAILSDTRGNADAIGVAAGAALGLSGGAIFTHRSRLRPPSVGAAGTGMTYGILLGSLIPSLDQPLWSGTRTVGGATMLGAGAGALLGAAVAQTTEASARQVTVVGIGGALGLGMGLGVGSLWPRSDTQPERIGAVAGVATLGAASGLLIGPLHLADPLPPEAPAVVVTTTAHGIFAGFFLAALVDPSGLPSETPPHQLEGGILLGGSLGIGAGLLLAPRVRLDEPRLTLLSGGTLSGTGIGRGLAYLIADNPGRVDSSATLAGALAGTAAGAIAASKLEPVEHDAGATLVGGAYGALLGALAPSLGRADWPGWNRDAVGGLMLGGGTGAVAGFITRMTLQGDGNDVGLTALAGGDGALTGLGWALLLGDSGTSSSGLDFTGETRPLRIGATIGTVAGLGLGISSWSRLGRLHLGPGDAEMIGASMALAAWNGALLPGLGHASIDDLNRSRMSGGFLAGAGTASFGAALLAPVVQVDGDLISNAIALDAVFTGAGAGVGALINSRTDAPIAGMLAGGAGGLFLGGLLHDRIDLGADDAPLLVLGTTEGLWTGAWLPHLLRSPTEITDGQRAAGVAAGAFGGLGLALLANTKFAPPAGDVASAALGSGIGTSLMGGVALLSRDIQDQRAVGLMLGGTGVGLVTGAYLAPTLRLDSRAAASASIGGVLGSSEALLFAWSSRADGGDQYGGAALLGAGVGTTLGLATAATLETSGTGTPAVAGFTAWGAWMGAFAGSLFARDAHEITAGGLIGANLGLVAGYGLQRAGAVEAGDFGWLSLFGAIGTAAGAGVGAPFASRGEPTPILAGLAIGPVVGMTVGAFVAPRLRSTRNGSSTGNVALRSMPARRFSPFSLSMRSQTPAVPPSEAPSRGGAVPLVSSTDVTREAQARHSLKRRLIRALDASVRISDCAPLIGALPTADSTASGTPPPMLIGLTGRWQ
jgi:hypothetical protein